MSTFWFVTAPLYSHTDWGGLLNTAKVLKKSRHQVLWVSSQPLAQHIETAGLDFAPIPQTGWLWPPPPKPDLSQIAPQEAVMLRYRRALDTWLSEDLVRQAVEALLTLAARIGRPDAMVIDPFLTAAAIAAEKLDVPLIVGGWPAQADLNAEAMFPVQKALGKESQQRIARLCEHFGVHGVNFSGGVTPSIRSPLLHVCYFTRSWYRSEMTTLLEQNVFVGGKAQLPDDAPPQWLQDIPDDWPLVLITLGTVFTGDLGFFSWAAQSAYREGLVPIVVLGRNPIDPEQKAQLKRALPPHTRLLNWAPFDHVLPRAAIIIHHGGMGTTHRAVVHGRVQIAVPHAADQRVQARRIAMAKVGLNLSAQDVQQGKIREGIHALLSDERTIARAQKLAEEMAALGGIERAAKEILKVIQML